MTSRIHAFPFSLARRAAAIGALLLLVAGAVFAAPDGKAFSEPEKAIDALVKAVRAYDKPALLALVGKGGAPIIESGDPVQDKNDRETFLALYDEKHELRLDGDRATLVIGPGEWPWPVPLVKTAKGWQFDAAAGLEEILNRRIGRNELEVIQGLLAIVDAQRVYYLEDHDDDGLLEYAAKFRSTVRRHDGLHWPVAEGEPPSPLGLFVAEAMEEGYQPNSPSYYGYNFRLLTSQGARAPGGAYDYLVRNDLVGGFAVIARPAEWGETGVMTFLVNHDGVIFQKDLGKGTAEEAAKIETYDPGDGWEKVDDISLQPVE